MFFLVGGIRHVLGVMRMIVWGNLIAKVEGILSNCSSCVYGLHGMQVRAYGRDAASADVLGTKCDVGNEHRILYSDRPESESERCKYGWKGIAE